MAPRYSTGKHAESLGVGGDEQEISKQWNLDDPYRYAPKKPDGDPWQVLLDPLLEKERIKCEGWKDEVGNLLIFAGLFSAVVTAFVIDSYKTLQPNDNQDIIALLSQIASNQLQLQPNLTNPDVTSPTSTSTSTLQLQLQLPSHTFIPPTSGILINTLWFLSLILSLGVVLIGIVALQWLRAYQSYVGVTSASASVSASASASASASVSASVSAGPVTPRRALALLRMREEAMERWGVWKVLMALPVLLESALVLFLVGAVVFLRGVVLSSSSSGGRGGGGDGGGGGEGQRGSVLWISVALVVGLIVLFLVGTTVGPAVQMGVVRLRMGVREVRFWRLWKGKGKEEEEEEEEEEMRWAPSQCPYKSPQASVVCAMVRLVLSACGFLAVVLWPWGSGSRQGDGDVGDGGEKGDNDKRKTKRKGEWKSGMSRCVWALRRTRTWMDYDLAWLNIRDVYVRSRYLARFGRGDVDDEETMEVGEMTDMDTPLYDTLATLRGFTDGGSRAQSQNGIEREREKETPAITLTSEVVVAAYHCLAQISSEVTTVHRLAPGRDVNVKGELEAIKERNGYFRFLWDRRFESLVFTSGPDLGTRASTDIAMTTLASDTVRLLHDQNLSTFLDHLSPPPDDPTTTSCVEAKEVFFHRQELRVRIQMYMLGRGCGLVQSSMVGVRGVPVFPGYLEFGYDVGVWREFGDEDLVFAHQYIHIIDRLFGYLSSSFAGPGIRISPTDLHARAEVLVLIEECTRAISRVTARLAGRQAEGYGRLAMRVRGMLEGVRACLERGVDGLGGISRLNGSQGTRPGPEDVLHVLYCAGMVVCGCVGLPEGGGSSVTAFESAYMGLKTFLKEFKKGSRGGYGGVVMVSREEEERWEAGVGEVERRFREGYPNDREVEKGLWDALECVEDAAWRGGGGGYIPFVVLGRMRMPVPRFS